MTLGGGRQYSPVALAAMREGSARGVATLKRQRAEGMAAARAWREAHRGFDWAALNDALNAAEAGLNPVQSTTLDGGADG